MKRTSLAIAQPTFLPWLGWFDLADQVDRLVILDDVSFSKQSWQQRNRIRTQSGLDFITVPVKKSGRFGQHIVDCELANQMFLEKILNSLKANYAKSSFFKEYFESFESTFRLSASNNFLVELNCNMIYWIADVLQVKTPMVRSTTLNVGGERGEHVAGICQDVGAKLYLSPAGAEDYLIEDRRAFDSRDIEIQFHVYDHPVYEQRFDPFIPFASAIDLIFNCGPNAAAIMRSGRRVPRKL